MKLTAARAAAILIALGSAWRILRYALRFPLWGDEAFVGLNLLDKGYRELAGPLEWGQVAPVLFLWAEKTAQLLFGPGELSLRALPLLAGLAAVVVFHRLARLALEPLEAAFAAGLLAVSYLPLRYASEVKPYSLDLLVSSAVLLLALKWRSEPERLAAPALLAVITPFAVALSYPSVFVLAAAGLVVLPVVWNDRRAAPKLIFAGWVLGAAAVFAIQFQSAGQEQFHGQGGFRNIFWQDAFPPGRPVPLVLWLVSAHTGAMLGYPAGGNDGGSAITFLLCLAGIGALHKTRRPGLLALCLLPFAVTLLASALRLYPYGVARVAQHLAAPICLLAGAGIGAALRFRTTSADAAERRAGPVFAALAVVACAGMAIDVARPWRSTSDVNLRAAARAIRANAGPVDRVVLVSIPEEPVPAVLQFYLRAEELTCRFDGSVGGGPLPAQIFVVSFRPRDATAELRRLLAGAAPPFAPVDERSWNVAGAFDRTPPDTAVVTRWRRAE